MSVQVQEVFRRGMTEGHVAACGHTRSLPTPPDIRAVYDLMKHYFKCLGAEMPEGDVVHSSHHGLQVCSAAIHNDHVISIAK